MILSLRSPKPSIGRCRYAAGCGNPLLFAIGINDKGIATASLGASQ